MCRNDSLEVLMLTSLSSVANFIWAFNIKPARSASGDVAHPEFTEGVILTPHPFKVDITVRSAEKADIIDRHFQDQSPLFIPFEQDLEPEDKEHVRLTRLGD